MAYSKLSLEDYSRLSGKGMGRLVKEGTISPIQLAECALELAKISEPRVNAYVCFLEKYALAQAASLERELIQNRIRGPLHGVPISIKDNFYLKDFPVLKGSRTSPKSPATYNSPMIEKMIAAGTIIIGKTTMPEFGWKGTGTSPLSGVTRNPYNPELNSGGSSSGSAATVATRAVPIALGSDAGGSIRIPASFCGVVGLKATLSRIPVYPGTVTETLSHVGPICSSVEDAALVLDVTEGADALDPLSYFSERSEEETRRADFRGGKLRVGFVEKPFGIAPDSEVAAAILSAMRSIEKLPVHYSTAAFSTELPFSIFEAMWVTGRGFGFVEQVTKSADIMDPGLVRCHDLAQNYSLSDYFSVIQARRSFISEMFSMFDAFDLLVMPTMPITAFAADSEVPEGGDTGASLPWTTWTPYTYAFNISGQPAISIPCGFANGMPAGLQIVGPWGCDRLVLDFAECCERAIAFDALAAGSTEVKPWSIQHR
jgi:aspartyl-tRNA(Asn)/glutamyl-tRNA(Gln) amidotransferase subunit A